MSLLPVIDVPAVLGANVVEFLQQLGGPRCIYVPGVDRSRCRFAVSLLHGNEPSGVTAFYELLGSGWQPVCDIYLVIMNVPAALTPPVFSHRQLPGTRDLNRCFKEPFNDEQGQLALALLTLIRDKQPEALIDIHNTSGSGPAFGVAVYLDSRHDALVSLFTERLIITEIRLGALMELSEIAVPTVTIECGGAEDPESHRIAVDGLRRYFSKAQLFDLSAAPWPIEILHNPVRLELSSALDLDYGESNNPATELTLRADIERFNFGVVDAGTSLGWCDASVLQKLWVRNAKSQEHVEDWFAITDGQLKPVRPMKLFMITGRIDIAKSDCLLYAVRCRPQ